MAHPSFVLYPIDKTSNGDPRHKVVVGPVVVAPFVVVATVVVVVVVVVVAAVVVVVPEVTKGSRGL